MVVYSPKNSTHDLSVNPLIQPKKTYGLRRNFVIMRTTLVLLLLLVCGCASNECTVTLIRTGEVSGITERYSVNQDALGTKIMALGTDSDAKRTTYSIDRQLALNVHTLVTDSLASLEAIQLNDTGEVTTGLQIDTHNSHQKIMWANVDPPKLATPIVDSLYHTMLRVEAEMIPPQ
jgi:hypothetical protein